MNFDAFLAFVSGRFRARIAVRVVGCLSITWSFKTLSLQWSNNFSYGRTEISHQGQDFVHTLSGLGLADAALDTKTIWTFREALTEEAAA